MATMRMVHLIKTGYENKGKKMRCDHKIPFTQNILKHKRAHVVVHFILVLDINLEGTRKNQSIGAGRQRWGRKSELVLEY